MILVRLAICLFALALLGFAVSISSAQSGRDYAVDEAVLAQR
jgi:nitrogen fixation-related uncharacterized protein